MPAYDTRNILYKRQYFISPLSLIKAETLHCVRGLVTMLLKKLKKSWIKSKVEEK